MLSDEVLQRPALLLTTHFGLLFLGWDRLHLSPTIIASRMSKAVRGFCGCPNHSLSGKSFVPVIPHISPLAVLSTTVVAKERIDLASCGIMRNCIGRVLICMHVCLLSSFPFYILVGFEHICSFNHVSIACFGGVIHLHFTSTSGMFF
jgi:hypothetical protein